MPHSMVNGRQIKAGRALLGWSRKDLAERAGVTADTVKVVEQDAVTIEALASTRARLSATLAGEGINFLNDSGVGVEIVSRDAGIRAEDLNASNDD
ncbi:transcriptional regulator [Xanthobacter autotrophicus DSM 597]|uniref:helix-turn-helix domain-containing protein n=1 Tax=Xanthobacter TaxID=279 RepID=UPI001AE73B75|nr:helix-turn-helix domain-containing protein [Xanthobacter flavus]MBP2152259.1 transcriptional regulator with XRE-family HTH domain [Xanthobacter flavus]